MKQLIQTTTTTKVLEKSLNARYWKDGKMLSYQQDSKEHYIIYTSYAKFNTKLDGRPHCKS